jgi:hypothetical protein
MFGYRASLPDFATSKAVVMSNIASLPVVVMCASLLGAMAGYLIARQHCRAWANTADAPSCSFSVQRLLLSLLGTIVGSLISSVSSYVMVVFRVPETLIGWLFRIFGA